MYTEAHSWAGVIGVLISGVYTVSREKEKSTLKRGIFKGQPPLT